MEPVVVFIVYQAARMGAPRGLGRPNCSASFYLKNPCCPFVVPLLPGQTVSKLFDTLFVVLDALLVAYVRSSFFHDVFYLLSEPLGVDFELPN